MGLDNLYKNSAHIGRCANLEVQEGTNKDFYQENEESTKQLEGKLIDEQKDLDQENRNKIEMIKEETVKAVTINKKHNN
jgi:hypothetical protein